MIKQVDCSCLSGDFHYSKFRRDDFGMDKHYGEVSILHCNVCNRIWLHYLFQIEGYSKSGKWYCGLIDKSTARILDPNDVFLIFEQLDWYFFGGSYYDGMIRKRKGKIIL